MCSLPVSVEKNDLVKNVFEGTWMGGCADPHTHLLNTLIQ